MCNINNNNNKNKNKNKTKNNNNNNLTVTVQMGEYVSTQTLVIHQWAGPSVVAQHAPNSTPDRAE